MGVHHSTTEPKCDSTLAKRSIEGFPHIVLVFTWFCSAIQSTDWCVCTFLFLLRACRCIFCFTLGGGLARNPNNKQNVLCLLGTEHLTAAIILMPGASHTPHKHMNYFWSEQRTSPRQDLNPNQIAQHFTGVHNAMTESKGDSPLVKQSIGGLCHVVLFITATSLGTN